jgi:hypothetical protein
VARWTASAKWAAGPALDGQRATLLALRLTEGLGSAALLARTAQLYEKRDRVTPKFGLPRADSHPALAEPRNQAEKATTTFLAGSFAVPCHKE